MSTEYAGAVDVEPPYRAGDQGWVGATGWVLSRDGRTLRPRPEAHLDACVRRLRELVALDDGVRAFDGVVAAYDDRTRELVTVTVRDGRVTRRTVRKPRLRRRSNVIDLAARRRAISRQLS